ncbi:MAG: hypothetical protein K9L78_03915 [Victivallales bacterium]|nr:hypothetical protein [Victivallales bacterium]
MTILNHLKFILILISYIFCFHIFSAVHTGKAIPLNVVKIHAGTNTSYKGKITYIAPKGQLLVPKIKTVKGKTIDPGTVVLKQGIRYWSDMEKADRANVRTAKQDLLNAKENLKRYQKLAPTGAESVETYQKFQDIYPKYYGRLINAKGDLRTDEAVLNTRTQYAPFEGYVNDVMYILGKASGNPEVIEILQLNPIGIKVKMSREKANSISPSTPVTVYIPGSNKKQGIYNGYNVLCKDGIILITENYPRTLPEREIQNVKYILGPCHPVDYIYKDYSSKKMLCVPKRSICKDKKGYFLWKAKNRKFFEPGKHFDPVFKIEKIYITPGNLQRIFAGQIFYQSIKSKSSKIEFGDAVLIPNPYKKMKPGDTIMLPPKEYVIMPGDKVKVKIGADNDT